jgi:hypothetical protein
MIAVIDPARTSATNGLGRGGRNHLKPLPSLLSQFSGWLVAPARTCRRITSSWRSPARRLAETSDQREQDTIRPSQRNGNRKNEHA